MISLFPFFNSIKPESDYFKLYVPRLNPNELFINASIFSQTNKVINGLNYCEHKSIENLTIYNILLDALMLFKNGNILKRNILFMFVDVNNKNLVLHISPLVKYLLTNHKNEQVTNVLQKLLDFNIINFTKDDNFVRIKPSCNNEYQLEKMILTTTLNIIQLHINLYHKESTDITNLFQYCQVDNCCFIASHEHICILHKYSSQQLTILDDIKKDYIIEDKSICNACLNHSTDTIYVPRDYISICKCCIKKNTAVAIASVNNDLTQDSGIINGFKLL